nr:hypothetical protein [Tanacetum cinerariifolium]
MDSFLGKRVAYAVVANYGRSSYARAMIEVRADVELKDTIVVAMPKLTREGFYTCNVHVEYEWKPLICACCKVFRHVLDECPTNIDLDVVARKNNVNTNGNKKKDVESTIEANTSGFLSGNVEHSSTSNTPMVENFDKMERIIIEGKVSLVDDEGKPLKNVDYLGDHDSEDEVASADNDMANFWLQRRMVMEMIMQKPSRNSQNRAISDTRLKDFIKSRIKWHFSTNKAKSQKISSSMAYLAISSKSNSSDKWKIKIKG